MTRKDYELIAATIRDVSRYLDKGQAACVRWAFVETLRDTDPRFNTEKFIVAATGEAKL